MTLLSLLILVLVLVVALWLVRQIPDPMIQKIALVIVIVLGLFYLLNAFGLAGPVLTTRLH